MITFEVLLNGAPLYTMDAGEMGALSTHLSWSRNKNHLGIIANHSSLQGIAMNGSNKTHFYDSPKLKIGDEITVRIVESDIRDTHVTHPTWWK